MKPQYLKKGDLLALAAPSRKVVEDDYKPFATYLRKQGFRLCFPDDIETDYHQFAGTDNFRADKINNMFRNPHIKAAFMIRGGYGAARIVDLLDWDSFSKQPKWLCGFSDATVLLNHAFAAKNVASLHCDMPVHFEKNGNELQNFDEMMGVLQGNTIEYEIIPHPLNKGYEANGILIGGNLSVLYSLMSSSSFPDMNGKILFLEDVDEYLYHIDRMLLSFDRAGVLENLSGMIVGSMSEIHDNNIPYGKCAEEIIAERCSKYNFPLFFNVPAGHTAKNAPLIIGEKVELSIRSNKVVLRQS